MFESGHPALPEVYGTTQEGDRVDAYFHPVTFKKPAGLAAAHVIFRAAHGR